jgi:hypothetical protein
MGMDGGGESELIRVGAATSTAVFCLDSTSAD